MDKLFMVACVLAAFSAFSYVVLIALLTIGLLRYKSSYALVPSQKIPFVSIIVAARNEASCIKTLLDCLVNQNYPDKLFEILVIDDHSTDETSTIAASYQRVNVIGLSSAGKGFGKKTALREGVRQSSGQVLLFTDADCIIGPDWVASMVEHLHNSKANLVCGPVVLIGNTGLFSQLQQLEIVSLMATTM